MPATSTAQRIRNHENFTAGDNHAFMTELKKFSTNGTPGEPHHITEIIKPRNKAHELETLAAGLYFLQLLNPRAAYELGIDLAEYMLPFCTYTSQDGQHQVADTRPPHLIEAYRTYLKSGNQADLKQAGWLVIQLQNSHATGNGPKTYNSRAINVVTELCRNALNYNLIGACIYALEAVDTEQQVEDLIKFIQNKLWMKLNTLNNPNGW